MIPAYAPQARGRSERGLGTWQGSLPQELRLRGIRTIEEANAFLRQEYVTEFNQRFPMSARHPGSAFLPCRRKDLDFLFSVQHEQEWWVGITRSCWEERFCRSSPPAGEELWPDVPSRSQSISTRVTAFATDLMWWGATTLKAAPVSLSQSQLAEERLWKRGSVKKSFGLSHLAWKSRPHRGIPTVTAAAISQPQTGHVVCSKKRTF